MHSMFTAEIGYPTCVIADRGSELLAVDTRAALADCGIEMQFILAGEHQLNLCERVHQTMWI